MDDRSFNERPESVNPFDDRTLEDPFPWYHALAAQSVGPIRLTHPTLTQTGLRCWAVPGNDEVRRALAHPREFSSVGSPGLIPVDDPIRTGSVLSTDDPEHLRYREVMKRSLEPRALKGIEADAERRATELVTELCDRGRFDAVADLAARYSLGFVGDLLGLPPDGREAILGFAVDGFNLFGPPNARAVAAARVLAELPRYLASAMTRDALLPGWGTAIWDAVDAGEISIPEGGSLLGVYLVAGVHTTVSALASAIGLLARHPEQWAALRARPALAQNAFHEAARLETPIQWVGRGVTTTVELGGVTLTRGDRVLLLLAAANRDGRLWSRPNAFEITRAPGKSLAFGNGAHHCIGRTLAVLQGAAVLKALARHVRTIEPDGAATQELNNVLRSPKSVPIKVTPA